MHFTLEQYKAFKYVAWVLFLGFVLFTYSLVMKLNAATAEIGEKTNQLNQSLHGTADDLSDLDTTLKEK